MALMLGHLYDALVEGGATPEKAREAAEEVADFERRIPALEKLVAVNTAIGTLTLVLVGAMAGRLFGAY